MENREDDAGKSTKRQDTKQSDSYCDEFAKSVYISYLYDAPRNSELQNENVPQTSVTRFVGGAAGDTAGSDDSTIALSVQETTPPAEKERDNQDANQEPSIEHSESQLQVKFVAIDEKSYTPIELAKPTTKIEEFNWPTISLEDHRDKKTSQQKTTSQNRKTKQDNSVESAARSAKGLPLNHYLEEASASNFPGETAGLLCPTYDGESTGFTFSDERDVRTVSDGVKRGSMGELIDLATELPYLIQLKHRDCTRFKQLCRQRTGHAGILLDEGLIHQRGCYRKERQFDQAVEPQGKGKFGVVYRMTDKTTGRVFAGKYVSVKGFQPNEPINWSRCSHHNTVITLMGLVWDGEDVILMSEFIDAPTLSEMACSTLDQWTALKLIYKLVKAVKDLHDKGIFHNDLHTGNILVSKDKIYILDFGSAAAFPAYEGRQIKDVKDVMYAANFIFANCVETKPMTLLDFLPTILDESQLTLEWILNNLPQEQNDAANPPQDATQNLPTQGPPCDSYNPPD